MARIDVLPSIEIIRGFKGILDFYVWRGLPCVRAWPRYRPARQTDASLAAALTFGAIVKAYALLANLVLLTYRQDALDQPRTARDIMVTGVYGNLHEASMSDFLDAIIIIRDGVVALTDLLHALDSIDTDEIVVNVDQSVLPPLAATTTNQATQITALQKLDDLQDALESKGLDRLLVRGMDQLLSFKESLAAKSSAIISALNGFVDSPSPAAGLAWQVKQVGIYTHHAQVTATRADQHAPGSDMTFHTDTTIYAAATYHAFPCTIYLEPGDVIRVYFTGPAPNNWLDVELTGRVFTLET